MCAVPRQGVQVERERGHEGLALARGHLGDLPLVQHDPTDELHIEGDHVPLQLVADDDYLGAEQPAARFPHRGERLGKEIVKPPRGRAHLC